MGRDEDRLEACVTIRAISRARTKDGRSFRVGAPFSQQVLSTCVPDEIRLAQKIADQD